MRETAGAQSTERARVPAILACGCHGRHFAPAREVGRRAALFLVRFIDLGFSTVRRLCGTAAAPGCRGGPFGAVAERYCWCCECAGRGLPDAPPPRPRRTLPTATAGGGVCWSEGKLGEERESCGRGRGPMRQGADMRAFAVCQHLALTCCCAAAPASCYVRWQVPRRLVTHDSPMARADQWHHHLHCARCRCHGLPDVHLERQ